MGGGRKKKSKKSSNSVGTAGASDAVTPDKSRPGAVEDYYEIGADLGFGGESVVKLGVDRKSGEKWAVKFIDKTKVDDISSLQREIDVMKRVRHPHCLQLREVFEDPERLILVTELVPGGELFDKIVEVGAYNEGEAASIVSQVCGGVAYLHAQGIAHRDLKPENLLVGGPNDDEIKIADFGLSKAFGGSGAGRLETSCGTPDYVAPEVLRGEVYDESVDMWSVGVISYILLCGFPPFWGDSQGELFDRILSVEFDFPDPEWTNVSADAKDFVKKLLVKDAASRLKAAEALEHPWLKSMVGKGGAALMTGEKMPKYLEQRKKGL
eukprot:CAMPEP_0170740412 /NCGR_PEP_ID=MMETSP0437-20130122/5670_1 /TAXON_ID=0 /ORGANISM="Sexangularia sp." /LENGTH=323 /DNA_ID=CAMNT_0011078911 /DNA_START=146 /DNA_END=1117 /DNA_ORIENTATION=+